MPQLAEIEDGRACRRCALILPIDAFYNDKRSADGRASICRDCLSAKRRRNRVARLDHYRARERARLARDRAIRRARRKQRELATGYNRKGRRPPEDPIKARARRLAWNAIQRGILVRLPCEVCGDLRGIHAHHEDYSRPLDVRWLCQLHHLRHHANTPPDGYEPAPPSEQRAVGLSLDYVVGVAADAFGVSVADICGRDRTRTLSLQRRITLALCRRWTRATLDDLGRKFDGRDHAGVLEGIRNTERQRQRSRRLAALWHQVELLLETAADEETE